MAGRAPRDPAGAAPVDRARRLVVPGLLQPRRIDLPQPAQRPLPQNAQERHGRRKAEPHAATTPGPTGVGDATRGPVAGRNPEWRAGVPRLYAGGIPGPRRVTGLVGDGARTPSSPKLCRTWALFALDLPSGLSGPVCGGRNEALSWTDPAGPGPGGLPKPQPVCGGIRTDAAGPCPGGQHL